MTSPNKALTLTARSAKFMPELLRFSLSLDTTLSSPDASTTSEGGQGGTVKGRRECGTLDEIENCR